jgi:hypothetical protein
MNTLLGERVAAVTAEPVSAPEPPHPVYAMTPAELEQYRAELERSLSPDAMPEYPPARVVLAAQLAEVIAEQAKPGRVRRRAGLDQ